MLTRAFYKMLGGYNGMNLQNAPSTVKDINGNDVYSVDCGQSNYSFTRDTNWLNAKIIIGSGTTKPKITDYILETEITEGYDCSTLSKRYIQGEEKDYLNIYGTITNTGTVDLTFSEIGLLGFQNISGSSTTYILFAREVYDTPITIAPGESVAVNVNIM